MTLSSQQKMHGPDEECAACYFCPGCIDGDPKRSRLIRLPGVVMRVCDDCSGDGVLCPNYDPSLGVERDPSGLGDAGGAT